MPKPIELVTDLLQKARAAGADAAQERVRAGRRGSGSQTNCPAAASVGDAMTGQSAETP